ncbi:hypothetical protein CAP35_13840 [Chitinophagaceae bacterium IBVUCB1]|nr:hypothetical protein CAP35_13840 [Chitinophagaceae bacterium IBVUCB1]
MTGQELKNIRTATGLSQEDFGKRIGMSREMVNKMENGSKAITKGTEITILQIASISEHINKNGELNVNRNAIPFYDVEAIAGSQVAEADMMPITKPKTMIDVGDLLRDSECAIRIYGNSMTPNYPSGCVVGLRKVNDGIIEYGKVYVVETEDNRYLKRLFKTGDDETYELYSDNVMVYAEGPRKGKFYYEPFLIHKSAIRSIYRVTGVIKRNENSPIFGKN